MTIQVSGSCITFSDSTVQCTAATGTKFVCGLACNNITAGDAVSTYCLQSGAVCTSVGFPIPCNIYVGVNPAISNQVTCNCSGYCINFNSDSSLMKFTDNCFASFQFIGGGQYCLYNCSSCSYTCTNQPSCVIVRAHSFINGAFTTGTIVACCVNSTGVGFPINKIYSIPGCSGTTGAFLSQYESYPNSGGFNPSTGHQYLMEAFLCYCTTTCTISLLRLCCTTSGCTYGCAYSGVYSFLTPDQNYFISFIVNPCIPCYNYTACCCWGLVCNTGLSINAIVRATTDSVCYLCNTCASSCTVALNSVLPATCATFFASFANVWANTCCYNFYPPRFMAGGVSPFTYGPDGWLLMHFNVCNNQGTTCNWCLTQKYWGFKPIADNCYALTCNAIVPDITCSSNCLIYYLCQNTGSSCFACEFNSASNCTYQGGIVDAGYMWDQGDCIKRQFVQGFSWDNCGTSSWQSALQMAVQCFCVGAGPCLYILGSTCCNRAQSCFCYVGCCCFPITPPGNFAPNSSVCGQYLACCPCCGAVSPYVGLASCVTFGGPGGGGSGQVADGTWYSRIGSYLARLYFAGTPYCWQLGCYYFSTTAAMACGGEWSCGYPTGAIGTLFEANPPYINVCVCCNCNASGTFNCSQCGITLSDCYTAVRGQFRACQLNYWQAGCTSPVRNVPSVFMIDCCYSNGLNPFQSYFYDAYGAYCNVVNGIGCYWNCCRATPIGYQNGPIAMNNGRYIVNFTNSGVFNTYTYFQTSGQLPANQHIISVSAVCSTPTAQCFIGIAQNTVSAGGTVCYAVPGMTDGSNFGTVLSAFSGGSTSGYCTCLLCCFCVTCNACVGTQYLPIYPVNACSGINLTGGVGCNCSSCTYGSVRFTSIYDTGLSKYSTIITPHC